MSELPPALRQLLSQQPPSTEAWAEFAREYTTLLVHVARSTSRNRDEAMDAYTYLLDRLSEDECRRLRAYTSDPRSKFTTWLVVVARRLCVDHYRAKYGRVRNEESKAERERHGLRRRIEDLSSTGEDADAVVDDAATMADEMERAELSTELRSLLDSLGAEDRLLLSLRFDDGLSAAEISGIMKFPSQFHVYRRINTVLGELRAALESRGFESAAS